MTSVKVLVTYFCQGIIVDVFDILLPVVVFVESREECAERIAVDNRKIVSGSGGSCGVSRTNPWATVHDGSPRGVMDTGPDFVAVAPFSRARRFWGRATEDRLATVVPVFLHEPTGGPRFLAGAGVGGDEMVVGCVVALLSIGATGEWTSASGSRAFTRITEGAVEARFRMWAFLSTPRVDRGSLPESPVDVSKPVFNPTASTWATEMGIAVINDHGERRSRDMLSQIRHDGR